MNFHIITLFPNSFSYFEESIIDRAKKNKKIKIAFYNPRDFTLSKHKVVDDRPYGGGPGMVMQVKPIVRAVAKAIGKKKNVKIIIFSPEGKQLTNTYAERLSRKYKHIVLIAGHYEGVDERVSKILKKEYGASLVEKISIGPYVLTGGELPAMVLVDTITRRLSGVLGKKESIEEGRIASHEVYTRPENIKHKGKTYKVPKVLLSGNHANIDAWRKKKQG